MGAGASSSDRQLIQPEDIGEFRKHTGPADQYVIPEIPEKRKVTDAKFTIIFGVCILLLLPFLIYTFVYADLDRMVNGYDKCGNVCGQKNPIVDGIPCSGGDETGKPLLSYTRNYAAREIDQMFIQNQCVDTCASGYVQIMSGCFPNEREGNSDLKGVNNFFKDVGRDINRSAGYIVGLCFIGLGFSIGMLCLFRYFVTVVVWVILIGSLLGMIALTGFLWYVSSLTSGSGNQGPYYLAIFFTIVSVILIVMLICLFKRIKLIIRLFKEAIKVIFGIPLILAEPFLTFFAACILIVIFVFFLLMMGTSGTLQMTRPDFYDYEQNPAMVFTIWYHLVICLWMAQFIVGCQHMVIAGSVSSYYFARDKSTVRSPIYNSFYNLIRYHLGTVAFGSLIITIITIIKNLIKSLANNRQAKILVECCLGAVEDFLKYLSKNAYIQTAMHGQPFFKSGKRAVRLLAANAISTIAVNSVGDFILFMAKLLIVVCTILMGVLMRDREIEHFWAAIVISAIVTSIIADCFFAVFETAIDTIFICFCEDSCINDGMERPYYMSVNLMQYMEEAKKTVKEKK